MMYTIFYILTIFENSLLSLPEENEAPAQANACVLISPNLRLQPELNLLTGNIAENYTTWKRQVEIY